MNDETSTNDPIDLDFLDTSQSPETSSPALVWEPQSEDSLPILREPQMSLVLQRLPAAQRPPTSLACATCPAAVWMSGATNLAAYCMVTRVMAWTRDEPADIEACDGREQALLAREMQPGA